MPTPRHFGLLFLSPALARDCEWLGMCRARPPPWIDFAISSLCMKIQKVENTMKLKTILVGQVAQEKLVQIEGKKPFLDLNVDVVLKSAVGKEYTQWVRVKVWHPLAEEIEPLLSKGSMVEVTGRPEVKPYSRRDGSPGAELIVHADEIRVLADEETEDEAA